MSVFLVDSNVAIRLMLETAKIQPDLRRILSDPTNDFNFSAAVAWELRIKSALGKLSNDISRLRNAMLEIGWTELAIDGEDGMRAGALPPHHKDPFDRIMIAQAQRYGLTILTADENFEPYGVKGVRG